MTYTRQQFISIIAHDIIKYATHIRPSVAIAQACLESANGNSELAVKAYNLFGIKASSPWTGPAYNKISGEHKNGRKVYEASDFREYTSWLESIKDHARYENTYNKAYHGGYSYPNNYLIGFEVCESLSATDSEFLKSEELTLLQAAEDLLYYKLPVNHDTVKLHRDYSSTTCPHRSWDLHVGRNASNTAANRQKMRQYFIDRIKYWTDVLNGVKPIPTSGNFTGTTVPNDTPKSGSNSSGYVLTPQTRRVGNWVANQRTTPSTAGDIVYELEANFHFEVKGYVHGQSIDGNDVWFVGKNSGQYIHSGGTTNPSTNNLVYLEDDPHNKVKKSFDTVNTFTADINLVIYDGPAEGTNRVGKVTKGTTIQFNKVYLSNRAWIGYKNGRGEDWYLPIADYSSKTNELGKLNGTLKYDLIRKQ